MKCLKRVFKYFKLTNGFTQEFDLQDKVTDTLVLHLDFSSLEGENKQKVEVLLDLICFRGHVFVEDLQAKLRCALHAGAEYIYIAACNACSNMMCIWTLMADLGFTLTLPNALYCDNTVDNYCAESSDSVCRYKHIDLKYNFLFEGVYCKQQYLHVRYQLGRESCRKFC